MEILLPLLYIPPESRLYVTLVFRQGRRPKPPHRPPTPPPPQVVITKVGPGQSAFSPKHGGKGAAPDHPNGDAFPPHRGRGFPTNKPTKVYFPVLNKSKVEGMWFLPSIYISVFFQACIFLISRVFQFLHALFVGNFPSPPLFLTVLIRIFKGVFSLPKE